MNDDEHIQLIVKGVDDGASRTINAVNSGLKGMERQAGATSTGVGRIRASLDSLAGWVRAGIGIKIGEQLVAGVERAAASFVDLFDDAVRGGQAWLLKVHDIQNVTGGLSTQISEIAAVMGRVGIPVESVDRILAMFGRNVATNEPLLAKLGIATRDANGEFLDAYTILQNTRQAFAAHGQSLIATAAAQTLFSRSGFELVEFLQLGQEEYRKYAEEAARSGLIVDDAATAAAERLQRTRASLNQTITGLQTAIFSGIEPTLEAFVSGFSAWIQTNMRQIVDFVNSVAGFITGVIGGLFGIDFESAAGKFAQIGTGLGDVVNKVLGHTDAAALSAKQWAAALGGTKNADDALTTSLNAQIKAIDGQIAAISRRSDALHAAMERARLDQALATAREQLADLKGNAPFTEGLSNAEAQLARQKHAQDIVDAQKAVADASGNLSQFEADQSVKASIQRLEAKKAALKEEVAAHKKAVDLEAGYQQYLAGFAKKQDAGVLASAQSVYAGITAQAQLWRDNGVKFAGDVKKAIGGLMDALLGAEVHDMHGSWRTGGLVGALGGLADVVGRVASFIVATVQWMASFLPKKPSGDSVNDFLWGPGGSPTQAAQDFWAQLIHTFSGGLLPGPTHAAGGVFDTLAPTRIGAGIMGEAGGETVAIIAHPRGTSGQPATGQSGPSTIIHNHFSLAFDFLSTPTDSQLQSVARRLTDLVDERMQLKADNSPVGMSAFRGATG